MPCPLRPTPSLPPYARVIAACFWVVGALVYLLSSYAHAAAVMIEGRRPGLALVAIGAAWLQLVATVILLIGAAVLVGGGLNNVGAGAVLFLIGFTLWTIALLSFFTVAFVISTVAPLMPLPLMRQFAWGSATSTLVLVTGMILYNVASISLVARDPPGLMLVAAIIYVIGSVYLLFGALLSMRDNATMYTPFWNAARLYPGVGAGAAALATGAALGAGAGAGMGAGMGAATAKGMGPGVGTGGVVGPGTTAAPTLPAGGMTMRTPQTTTAAI
jgi:hypothetical protein